MRGQEERITETLSDPEVVVQSESDDTVRLFHRFYGELPVGDKYLCVVVKYLPGDAFVITAYFTDRLKRGETLWRR